MDITALLKMKFPDAEITLRGEDCASKLVIVSSEFAGKLYAVVNGLAVKGITLLPVSAVNYEGEPVEDRLERRTKHWISSVRQCPPRLA